MSVDLDELERLYNLPRHGERRLDFDNAHAFRVRVEQDFAAMLTELRAARALRGATRCLPLHNNDVWHDPDGSGVMRHINTTMLLHAIAAYDAATKGGGADG